MKRWLASLLLLTILALGITGCGEEEEIPGLTDEQAVEILTDLLPHSTELMHLFFGEGLAYVEPESVIEYDGVQYEPVQEGQAYTSIQQMKAALEGVFTSDYQRDLCVLMFDGYETPTETSEEGEEVLDETILPRYREVDGVLQIDIKYEGFAISSFPTAQGAKVLRGNAVRVVVEVPCLTEAGESRTTRVNLALEGGVWLLDGPTY